MIYILLDILINRFYEYKVFSVLAVFDQVQFRALLAAGLAYFIVVFFGKRVIRALISLKIGDGGETDAELLREHAASKANVPTMGGVLIVGAIFISTFLLADIRVNRVYLRLFTLILLAAVGGADDWLKLTAQRRGTGRQGLFAWEKLVFQLGIGFIVGFFAYKAGDDPQIFIQSPTLDIFFARYEGLTNDIEVTEDGIIVTQTSDDPELVAALQTHAGEVSDMAARGMQAVHERMMQGG